MHEVVFIAISMVSYPLIVSRVHTFVLAPFAENDSLYLLQSIIVF